MTCVSELLDSETIQLGEIDMTQSTKIYLADDKDGNKVIVVGYPSYLDSFPTAIKVGEWREDVDDMNETWGDEPLIFEIDELFRTMRRPSYWVVPYNPETDDDLTVDKIQYGYYQLKNLCERIVTGSKEPVTVECSSHFASRNMYTGWSAYATIDPVLAQAILDSYN
jgi:hypothetical protein